jgi:putative heme-binding domain-containing protein
MRQRITLGICLALFPGSLFAQTISSGKALFETHCALCHGIGGKGSRGPSLTRSKLDRAPDDEALKRVISNGLGAEMPAFWFLPDPDVANLVVYVRDLGKQPQEPVTGDASAGARVYEKSRCAACHVLAGEGTAFGPELTEIGSKRSPAHLRESIVKPAAAVPEGFLMVEAKPKQGAAVRGVRLNEDTFTIQIRDAAGKPQSFRKADLADLKKLRGESPMPAYANLSAADLDDLVAFLASKGKKK